MLTRPTPSSPAEELEALTCIAHLYRLLLQRPSDRAGLLHHADRLLAGESLPGMVRSLLESGEAMRLWAGLEDGQLAWTLWLARGGPIDPKRGVATRIRERRQFRQAWHGDLDGFIAGLVRSDAVRGAVLLPSLFPAGIDPAEDDVYRAWSYRLWAAETARGVERGIMPMLPRLLRWGPPILLTMQLGEDDTAEAITSSIASLVAQSYRSWRLSLQGDLPPGSVLADPRVSHAGFDQAPSPRRAWLGWLQAGDTLSPLALALFAQAIRRQPDAVLAYCDEDRIGQDGLRSHPVLKPGWDPVAAERADFAGDLALYRGDHLSGRLARLWTGSDGQARLLAATDGAPDRLVMHLPAVLFHRASHPEPRSRAGASASPFCARTQPPVSVVIATRDRADLLDHCVETLRTRTDYPSIQIVLVDNGSTEPDALALLERLAATGCHVLRRPGPFNWSALNNDGVRASSGEVVVLMNNDVACIDPAWLGLMVSACLRPQAGIVGARLLFPDGLLQHAGIVIGPGPEAAHVAAAAEMADASAGRPAIRRVAAVTGACMAFRREVFDRVDGLDAVSLPVTWNDIDFCLRVRAIGLHVLLVQRAVLVHDEGSTRTPDRAAENQSQLARTHRIIGRRHADALRSDLFSNPQAIVASGGGRLDPHAPQRLWRILRDGRHTRRDRCI